MAHTFVLIPKPNSSLLPPNKPRQKGSPCSGFTIFPENAGGEELLPVLVPIADLILLNLSFPYVPSILDTPYWKGSVAPHDRRCAIPATAFLHWRCNYRFRILSTVWQVFRWWYGRGHHQRGTWHRRIGRGLPHKPADIWSDMEIQDLKREPSWENST